MTTPTKPVAEIVAEHRLWLRRVDPNGCRKRILGDDGCNCGACDFEAIVAELTRLSEENGRLKGLLHSGKQVMKRYGADKAPIGISGYKDGFKSVE